MKNIMIIMVAIGSMLFAEDVTLGCSAIADDGAGNVTFTISMENTTDVGGMQFTFDTGGIVSLTSNMSGGGSSGDAGWMISTNASGTVLGFSLMGGSIAPGSADLIDLVGTYDTANLGNDVVFSSTLGATDAFSDPSAQSLSVMSHENGWTVGDGSSLGNDEVGPNEFSLSANYPNPFNPSTTIDYSIANPGNVDIVVYDMIGREINHLVSAYQENAGQYSVVWNGLTNEGVEASAGVYIYKMTSGDFVKTNKMLLVK
jgi:hypothetical protein